MTEKTKMLYFNNVYPNKWHTEDKNHIFRKF